MLDQVLTRLRAIGSNRSLGASELLARELDALTLLAAALAQHPSLPTADLRRTLRRLLRQQPAMAPLLNLTWQVLALLKETDTPDLVGALRRLVRGWKRDRRRDAAWIAQQLAELLPRRGRLVTYSRSGTILRALRYCRRCGCRMSVAISQGSPGMEGVGAARELARMGYDVTLTTDAALFGQLTGARTLLVGADAILPQGLVNKVGTRALVRAAHDERVSVLAACGRDKHLGEPLLKFHRIPNGKAIEIGAGGSLESLAVVNPMFDVTPLTWFDTILSPDRRADDGEARL